MAPLTQLYLFLLHSSLLLCASSTTFRRLPPLLPLILSPSKFVSTLLPALVELYCPHALYSSIHSSAHSLLSSGYSLLSSSQLFWLIWDDMGAELTSSHFVAINSRNIEILTACRPQSAGITSKASRAILYAQCLRNALDPSVCYVTAVPIIASP